MTYDNPTYRAIETFVEALGFNSETLLSLKICGADGVVEVETRPTQAERSSNPSFAGLVHKIAFKYNEKDAA